MHSIGSHMLDFIKLTLNHKKTTNFITLAHASTSRMFDIRSPNNVKAASLVLFIVAFIDFQNKKHSSPAENYYKFSHVHHNKTNLFI